MAEWLVEEGIGEERAILLHDGEIVAARLHWPDELAAGQVLPGRLIRRRSGSFRGVAQLEGGTEVLLDHLPADAAIGREFHLAITRAPIAERGRLKLAQARVTDAPLRAELSLAAMLEDEGHSARIVRRFPVAGWRELITEAFEREILFAGGSILLAATPAMVLVDIDGPLPPRELALAAVPAITQALSRLDIGGAVGIDFPTIQAKAERKAVDSSLDDALAGWPHERTAMNGFGFVQIVSRLERPSLLHRATYHRAAFASRQLLRLAERVEEPGALLLTCHPAIAAQFRPEWIAELERRTGREIRLAADPSLALEAGFAQAVPR